MRTWLPVAVLLAAIFGTFAWTKQHYANAATQSRIDTLTIHQRTTDTLWRHDTLVFSRVIKVPLALHDTVVKHLSDTILVKTYIAASDSALHACSAVFQTCKASIAIRDSIIDQYRKLKPSRVSVGIGATCGYGFKGGDCTAGLTANVRIW